VRTARTDSHRTKSRPSQNGYQQLQTAFILALVLGGPPLFRQAAPSQAGPSLVLGQSTAWLNDGAPLTITLQDEIWRCCSFPTSTRISRWSTTLETPEPLPAFCEVQALRQSPFPTPAITSQARTCFPKWMAGDAFSTA